MNDNSVDSIVTDPPYGLSFMGNKWDYQVPTVEVWKECLRVLKPGGFMLCFSGSRTYHRMVVNIEDAGFEIRDQIMWIYGSGFPKSHNLQDEWEGWGSALKPAHEPIVLARKPLSENTIADNVNLFGTGAINIAGCRVETTDTLSFGSRELGDGIKFGKCKPTTEGKQNPNGRWPANIIHDGSEEVLNAFPNATGQLAKAKNDGVDTNNSIYGKLKQVSNSPEPRRDSGSAARFFYCAKASKQDRDEGLDQLVLKESGIKNDSGRGFSENDPYKKILRKNTHPTVKPVNLMRYLCRLITPSGGVILDPYAGSGSTGKGGVLEGFKVILIEQEQEYIPIIEGRLLHAEKTYKSGTE